MSRAVSDAADSITERVYNRHTGCNASNNNVSKAGNTNAPSTVACARDSKNSSIQCDIDIAIPFEFMRCRLYGGVGKPPSFSHSP